MTTHCESKPLLPFTQTYYLAHQLTAELEQNNCRLLCNAKTISQLANTRSVEVLVSFKDGKSFLYQCTREVGMLSFHERWHCNNQVREPVAIVCGLFSKDAAPNVTKVLEDAFNCKLAPVLFTAVIKNDETSVNEFLGQPYNLKVSATDENYGYGIRKKQLIKFKSEQYHCLNLGEYDDYFEAQPSALHLAVFVGNHNLISVLVEGGTNVEAVDGIGHTPLSLALTLGQVESVKALLQAEASAVELHNGKLLVNLALSVKNGQQMAELLLKNGADINALDANQKTVLMTQIENNSAPNIAFALKQGAKIDVCGFKGHNAVSYAIFVVKGRSCQLDVFFKHYKEEAPNINDQAFHAALDYAAEIGSISAVRFFLSKGISHQISAENQFPTSCLMAAAINKRPECCQELLRDLADKGAFPLRDEFIDAEKKAKFERKLNSSGMESAKVTYQSVRSFTHASTEKKVPLPS
ncbi:MAG: ankyrin repeat domain-containing protein [Parashewanella sp.]